MGLLSIGVAASPSAPGSAVVPPAVRVNPLRDAFYGDLHLHTSYSLDAYLLGGTQTDPGQAYRFAQGEVIDYLGQPARRREPLDFLAVTDHSESMGVLNQLEDPDSPVSQSDWGRNIRKLLELVTDARGVRDFSRAHLPPDEADPFDELWRDYFAAFGDRRPAEVRPLSAAAWTREIDFANRFYQPGRFTTFIAYEWSSQPQASNLHRNVIFRGDSAPTPFSSIDSKDPRDLWKWLETIRGEGFEALAIPHNGNASNGAMYDWVTAPEYMDRAYAQLRQANEPLSEIAQSKGASETHPLLSPNDEFAGFEIFDFLAQYRQQVGRVQGSYLREALGAGLVLQRRLETNPFKYGFVGGSDLHSGLSVSAQDDYDGSHWISKLGGGKPTLSDVQHGLAEDGGAPAHEMLLRGTSGNLTGVWAESNTRDSIYAALRRRETFATSGTRMRFRFFGGWGLAGDLPDRKNWVATAYAQGVAMGGDLPPMPAGVRAPSFAIWASKDPNSANLDRVQVVKVWEQGGQQHERVFDVAWSGRRVPDAAGKLPAVGNTVDVKTATYRNTIGAVELKAVWSDPLFDATRLAAYYLRVLEIPTPRWPTLLAAEFGVDPPKDVPPTAQQRGWSSPIWYTPERQ